MTILIVVTYLLGLPVSVWLLASACAIVDEPAPAPALLRLLASICVLLVFLLLTDRTLWQPLAYAFGTVVTLHIAGFMLVRKRGVGVPIYEHTPPPPPVLLEEEVPEQEPPALFTGR